MTMDCAAKSELSVQSLYGSLLPFPPLPCCTKYTESCFLFCRSAFLGLAFAKNYQVVTAVAGDINLFCKFEHLCTFIFVHMHVCICIF